jgi:hypothetical protein
VTAIAGELEDRRDGHEGLRGHGRYRATSDGQGRADAGETSGGGETGDYRRKGDGWRSPDGERITDVSEMHYAEPGAMVSGCQMLSGLPALRPLTLVVG